MNKRYSLKISLFFLSIIGLLLFFYGQDINYSQAGVGLNIQPIKVRHTINPGKSISGKIQLTNVSDEAVKVETKMQDFVPMAGTVNIQIVTRAEGITTVRDWITLDPPGTFTLKKNETKEVIYAINTPANAEPGGHFGVIYFKANRLNESGVAQLKIGTEVGMLVFVTIPGEHLQKGKILDFKTPLFIQKGPVNFTVNFENTGTVHFEPKGIITITNLFGKKVGEVPVSGQIVLPTGVRDLSAQWETGFLLGRYKAVVEMKDGEGNVLTAETISFYGFPLWYGLGFLAAGFGIFFGLKLFRRKFSFNIKIAKKS